MVSFVSKTYVERNVEAILICFNKTKTSLDIDLNEINENCDLVRTVYDDCCALRKFGWFNSTLKEVSDTIIREIKIRRENMKRGKKNGATVYQTTRRKSDSDVRKQKKQVNDLNE